MKKLISAALAAAVITSVGAVSAASLYSDTDSHWAKAEIETWSGYGILQGSNGQFAPNRSITRGEFAVVLNRLMNYQEEAENIFTDLDDGFYKEAILKLAKAGVMQGDGGKISPKAQITREQAAAMLSRALGIDTAETADKAFADLDQTSAWAMPYINAMINSGIMNGSGDKINPKSEIKRAEIVKMLDNAVLPVLKSGEQNEIKTDKIVVVSAPDVVLKKCEISGTLIITEGVESGNLTISESKLGGKVIINNDRKGFIKLENTTAGEELTNSEAVVTETAEEPKTNQGNTDSGSSSSSGGGGGTSKPNYEKINKEMVANLEDASADIAVYLDPDDLENYTVFTNEEKAVLKVVKACIDDTITYKKKAEIDADFVKKTFKDEIADVEEMYEEMKKNETDGAFLEKLIINLKFSTLEWLADAFGLKDYI